MMTKTFTTAALALAAAATAIPSAASAQRWNDHQPRYEQSGYSQVGYRDGRRNRNRDRDYYNNNRRCYDKGNGGLAIGGIAGGLLGHTVAGRGDRTLGAVLGAAGGALLGRHIDKKDGARC